MSLLNSAIDVSSSDFRCRKTQLAFDKCVFDKLGQERPPLGYFSKIRVHDTKRPRPVTEIPLPEATVDPVDPDTVPTPESAKYGSRHFFFK